MMNPLFHYDFKSGIGENCSYTIGACEVNGGAAPHFQSEDALNNFIALMKTSGVIKDKNKPISKQTFSNVDELYHIIPFGTLVKVSFNGRGVKQAFIGEKINDKFLNVYTVDGCKVNVNVTKVGSDSNSSFTIRKVYNSRIDLTRDLYGAHEATVIERLYPVGTVLTISNINGGIRVTVTAIDKGREYDDYRNVIHCVDEGCSQFIIHKDRVYGDFGKSEAFKNGINLEIIEVEQPPMQDEAAANLLNNFPEGCKIKTVETIRIPGGIFREARVEEKVTFYTVEFNNGSHVELNQVNDRGDSWTTMYTPNTFLKLNPQLVSIDYLQLGQAYPYGTVNAPYVG